MVKNANNLKFMFFLVIIIVFISFVLAQGNMNYNLKTETANKYTIQQMTQSGEMFQNKYQTGCPIPTLNEINNSLQCSLYEKNNKLQFEINEQKRFLFFNIKSTQTHEIDESGEIIRTRYNFWYRLTNLGGRI